MEPEEIEGTDPQQLEDAATAIEVLIAAALAAVAAQAATSMVVMPGVPAVDVNVLGSIPQWWEQRLRRRIMPALRRTVDTVTRRLRGLFDAELERLGETEVLYTGTGMPELFPADDVGPVRPLPDITAEDILAQARNRLVAIGDDLWVNARTSLVEGMQQGESIPQLAARVRAAAGVTEPRARVIARTEVISASNASSIAQARSTGIGLDKIWIATEDDRTRLWHREADGQTVPIDEPFIVGGEALDFPGDPTGSAANVINERCSIGYRMNTPTVAAATPTLDTREYVRDRDGQFSEVPGGGDDDDVFPAAFELIESAKVKGKSIFGPYHVASFTDTDGAYGPEGGTVVAVTGDERPNWAKTEHPGDEARIVVPAQDVESLAARMDDFARQLEPWRGNTDGDEDVGPERLFSDTLSRIKMAGFRDPFGDLYQEGGTFVVVGGLDWDDNSQSESFESTDIPEITAAMRRLAADPPTTAAAVPHLHTCQEGPRPWKPGPCKGWKHNLPETDPRWKPRPEPKPARKPRAKKAVTPEVPAEPDVADTVIKQRQERQKTIDQARSRAGVLAELEQLALMEGASPRLYTQRLNARIRKDGLGEDPVVSAVADAVRTGDTQQIMAAIEEAARKAGLERIGGAPGNPDQVMPFDRTVHRPTGGDIPDGAPAQVVRPGYRYRMRGEGNLLLEKATVEAARTENSEMTTAAAPPLDTRDYVRDNDGQFAETPGGGLKLGVDRLPEQQYTGRFGDIIGQETFFDDNSAAVRLFADGKAHVAGENADGTFTPMTGLLDEDEIDEVENALWDAINADPDDYDTDDEGEPLTDALGGIDIFDGGGLRFAPYGNGDGDIQVRVIDPETGEERHEWDLAANDAQEMLAALRKVGIRQAMYEPPEDDEGAQSADTYAMGEVVATPRPEDEQIELSFPSYPAGDMALDRDEAEQLRDALDDAAHAFTDSEPDDDAFWVGNVGQFLDIEAFNSDGTHVFVIKGKNGLERIGEISFEDDDITAMIDLLNSVLPDEEPTTAAAVGAPNLFEHWVHGEGAQKIQWKLEGAFDRCVEQLDNYSEGGTEFDPEGLCARYYRAANGRWPGEKKGKDDTAMMEVLEDTGCVPCQLAPKPGEMWHAVAHIEGVSTGQRVWQPGSLSWREPPFAFHWEYSSSAHGGQPMTTHVGMVTRMARVGDEIHAWGNLDLANKDGAEVGRKLADGFIRGVSMGPGREKIVYDQVWPEGLTAAQMMTAEPEQWIFTDYMIGELTAVSVPAQAGAYVEPTDELLAALGKQRTIIPELTVASAAAQTFIPHRPSLNCCRDAGGKVIGMGPCKGWKGNRHTPSVVPPRKSRAGAGKTPAQARERLEQGEKMFGSDRSKWTPKQRRDAEALEKVAAGSGNSESRKGSVDKRTPKRMTPAQRMKTANDVFRASGEAGSSKGREEAVQERLAGMSKNEVGKVTDLLGLPKPRGWNAFSDQEAIDYLARYAGAFGLPFEPEDAPVMSPGRDPRAQQTALTVAAAAGSTWTVEVTDLPPADAFVKDFPPGTPPTITPDGRFYGYFAPGNTAHRGSWRQGVRKTAKQQGKTDYSRWLKEIPVAGGGTVLAGPITSNCMHAPTQGYGTLDRRHQFYEDVCSIVAKAAVGEDPDGARWFAGVLVPWITAQQIDQLLMCNLSLDTQPHAERAGWLDFVGVLAVPMGAWPMSTESTGRIVTRVQEHDGLEVVTASSAPISFLAEPTIPDEVMWQLAGVDPAAVMYDNQLVNAALKGAQL